MKKKNITRDTLQKNSKANELVEKYISLGFSHEGTPDSGLKAGSGAPFAPISFLPHIDYTVSSVIGG